MTQPTALFLADILEDAGKPADIAQKCAAELRRLHTEVEEQCRLNGMGSEREAKLLAENKKLNQTIEDLRAAIAKAEENT